MHVLLADSGWEQPLADQLPCVPMIDGPWLTAEFDLQAVTQLAFARQVLPHAEPLSLPSINAWADAIVRSSIQQLSSLEGPWMLHLWPAYGDHNAGTNRCQLIDAAIQAKLKKFRRSLLRRRIEPGVPITPETSIVQACLTSPETGWLSIAPAPLPWNQRAFLSPFVAGNVPIAEDKAAPSRAFSKLVEAEKRLGRAIESGETVVDLGAAPGSWTYVALQREARVSAVDRSPLRDDLMSNPRLEFVEGDAFRFRPREQVDWLICDVIAAPERSIDLLHDWLQHRRMRHFIVTIKFKGATEYGRLDSAARELMPLCEAFRLQRLCANKNEVTAFGTASH